MKQIKQLATSKRMGFTHLMNTGWIITMLAQLKQVRDAAESLAYGYEYAEYFGLLVVVVAFIGMCWTKLHDDAQRGQDANDTNQI